MLSKPKIWSKPKPKNIFWAGYQEDEPVKFSPMTWVTINWVILTHFEEKTQFFRDFLKRKH
jgi:hypothetical protein